MVSSPPFAVSSEAGSQPVAVDPLVNDPPVDAAAADAVLALEELPDEEVLELHPAIVAAASIAVLPMIPRMTRDLGILTSSANWTGGWPGGAVSTRSPTGW